MSRRVIDLWYDVNNRILVTGDGTSLEQAPIPYVFFKENVLIRLRLVTYDTDAAAFIPYTNLAATDVFSFALDDDYSYTTELWCKENNLSCNIAGDWVGGATADPTAGQISIRADFNTTSIEAALGTSPNISGIAELQIRPVGETLISGCMSWELTVYNLIDNVAWVQLINNTDYDPTAASTSTITMLTDQSSNIAVDAAVRVYWDSAYHYGLASSISASLLSVANLTLPLGASAMEELYYELMPSTVEDGYYTQTEMDSLLASKQGIDADAVANNIAVFDSAWKTVDSGKYFVNSVTGNSVIEVPTVRALKTYVDAATGSNMPIPAGSTQGDFIYRGASVWERLAVGASGSYIMSQGAGANPVFVNPPKLPTPTDGDILVANGGVWSSKVPGTAGQFLQTRGAGVVPIWSAGAQLPNSATGSILWKQYSGATGWVDLAPGASGSVLMTQGAGGGPIWRDRELLPNGVEGDMLYNDGATWLALPSGSAGQFLTQGSNIPVWATAGLPPSGAQHGDVQYFDGVEWTRLGPGISGQLLKTRGIGSSPVWGSASGTGDVMGPATNLAGYVPRWDGVDSLTLLEGMGVASGMSDIPATGSHNWMFDTVGALDAVEDRSFTRWQLAGPASVSPTPQVCDTVTAVNGGSWEWPYRVYSTGAGGTETNARCGHVMAIVGNVVSGSFEYTEWATQEIGNATEDELDFTVDLDSGNLRLLATVASGGNWYIRGKRMRIDW